MIRNPPGCGPIKMAVPEWNVSAGNWGMRRDKFTTIGTADHIRKPSGAAGLVRRGDRMQITVIRQLTSQELLYAVSGSGIGWTG